MHIEMSGDTRGKGQKVLVSAGRNYPHHHGSVGHSISESVRRTVRSIKGSRTQHEAAIAFEHEMARIASGILSIRARMTWAKTGGVCMRPSSLGFKEFADLMHHLYGVLTGFAGEMKIIALLAQ
jgi:hypothetical protein